MMLTTHEIGARLGIKTSRVRQLILGGQIQGTKHGRDWVVTEDEVARFTRDRRGAGRPSKEAGKVFSEDRVDVSQMKAGDTVTLSGKTWVFIGANDQDAFFVNKRAKYASFARNRGGVVYLYDLSRLDATADQVRTAHGF